MGFPVLQPIADAFGCQPIDPTIHIKQPHFSIGNSQCVPNTAAVILAALLSVRLLHPQTVRMIQYFVFAPMHCGHWCRPRRFCISHCYSRWRKAQTVDQYSLVKEYCRILCNVTVHGVKNEITVLYCAWKQYMYNTCESRYLFSHVGVQVWFHGGNTTTFEWRYTGLWVALCVIMHHFVFINFVYHGPGDAKQESKEWQEARWCFAEGAQRTGCKVTNSWLVLWGAFVFGGPSDLDFHESQHQASWCFLFQISWFYMILPCSLEKELAFIDGAPPLLMHLHACIVGCGGCWTWIFQSCEGLPVWGGYTNYIRFVFASFAKPLSKFP